MGKQNPFRYRGYYYDAETGMYYLKSRYYDSEIRRFISTDRQVNGGLLGKNMFCYCENNPTTLCDPSGHVAVSAITAIGKSLFAGAVTAAVSVVSRWLVSNVVNIAKKSKQLGKSISAKIADTQDYLSKGKAIWGLETTEKERTKIIAEAALNDKKQAFFPANPYDFNPKGLEMTERVNIGSGKNGGIIQWHYPETDIVIFEWNEDYKYGSHYHVMELGTKIHTAIHYPPTSMVPEPWNTLYFN